MAAYSVREAEIKDIDYIVHAIVEAEKSGTEILSYSKVFNLSEEEIKTIFRLMLLEEIDGCEFSLSSYLVAEWNNQVVATIGGWVETDENPSSMTKSNMLKYFLPNSSILYANQSARITSELIVDHVKGAFSLVVVYISPEHRGHRLFELLTDAHINRNPGIRELSIQVMSNNVFAIGSYERYGFAKSFGKKSDDSRILQFLPYNEKIVMNKVLNF